jgi:ABC-type multidrug transport system ATPase subunit
MKADSGARPAGVEVEATTTVALLALECRGLTYRFGSHTAVNNVDLFVRPGDVFGLLGPNGAGKTTTIRVITTLLPSIPGGCGSSGWTPPATG